MSPFFWLLFCFFVYARVCLFVLKSAYMFVYMCSLFIVQCSHEIQLTHRIDYVCNIFTIFMDFIEIFVHFFVNIVVHNNYELDKRWLFIGIIRFTCRQFGYSSFNLQRFIIKQRRNLYLTFVYSNMRVCACATATHTDTIAAIELKIIEPFAWILYSQNLFRHKWHF